MIDARICTALPAHPKTKKLIRKLGDGAAWRFVCLLLWVASNRPNGDLAGLDVDDLEIAVDWSGEEGAFVQALCDVGFLDGEPGAFKVHDWAEHNPWAAGHDARADRARWMAACKWHGREGAAAAMPELAAKFATSMPVAADSIQNPASSMPVAENSMHVAENSMHVAENSSAPSPSPSPSPSPNPRSKPFAAESATPPKARKPKAAQGDVETALQAACRETWQAYGDAYLGRYGVEPLRNAKVSSQVKAFVQRVPASEAPQVASWFLRHPNQYYTSKCHDFGLLLADAEKLRMEWATGTLMTSGRARQADRAGTTMSAVEQILAERGLLV